MKITLEFTNHQDMVQFCCEVAKGQPQQNTTQQTTPDFSHLGSSQKIIIKVMAPGVYYDFESILHNSFKHKPKYASNAQWKRTAKKVLQELWKREIITISDQNFQPLLLSRKNMTDFDSQINNINLCLPSHNDTPQWLNNTINSIPGEQS
jgi:hypothetical protein